MAYKRIIDLSHELHTGMPTFPGDRPKPQITMIGTINGSGITMSSIRVGSHYGTHIDAPRHFFTDGKTLLDFQIDRFFGKAICLRKNGQTSGEIMMSDQEIETIQNEKPEWILVYTGFDKYWGKPNYFTEHPYLSKRMVKILTETKTVGIGVDFPSIDGADAQKENYPVHHIWLGAGRLAVENLRGLQQLPEKELFDFCAVPLKINTEGAPVRALAFL
ncbi:cyclase family protein [bacterium]|nr:cyclase family protein [bacterium]MBU1065579.1 cyclase family protein [bacterium]MBU1633541.1 cyclase family protein [bacterium]MBU1872506.1 cyclase family protein [bacterium]